MTEEKLKTLKEINSVIEGSKLKALQHSIQISMKGNNDWFSFSELIDREDLRQEAIKWIKELNDGNTKYFITWNDKQIWAVQKWIKHFFNISDKEIENAR